jgi:Flp pilus assembly protein TadG
MRPRPPFNILHATHSTAAIEFSILALPFLLLVLGIFEFARLYWTQEALQESATAGARCMGILQASCTTGGATASYVQQVAATWGIILPSSDIVTANSASCGGIAGFSQVQINYTFKTIVPYIVPIASGGMTLTVQACYPNNL